MTTLDNSSVLLKLIEVDKGLPKGVTLTFAVDNLIDTMDEKEQEKFVKIIYSLIAKDYLAKHTDKETSNGIPFWLELTDRGLRYRKKGSA